jgi:hypothetical protein
MKIRKGAVFALSVLLVTCERGLTAPAITGVDGDDMHGTSVTIHGSGFGAKATPAPFKYDDFEGGTLDARVTNGWYTTASTSGYWPIYSDDYRRSVGAAEKSAYLQHDVVYNSTLGLTGLNWGYGREAYISTWYYCRTEGAASRNFKILAWRGGPAGNWDPPNVRVDMYPVTNSGHAYIAACDTSLITQDWGIGGNVLEGGWHRLEMFVHTGTAGPADNDGVCLGWRDLGQWWTLRNFEYDFSSQDYDNIYFASYFATDTGSPMPQLWWYWDEIYVDTTQARVEVGNAPTWAACTHREIQIPTAWSDGEITFTVNRGSLISPNTYLFVVDAGGAVNSTGYFFSSFPTYDLTVNSGSGGGPYLEAAVAAVQAGAPPEAMIFDHWSGDTSTLADPRAEATTVTMPAHDVEITAEYTDAPCFALTVNNGSGGGVCYQGASVAIAADLPPSGKVFDEWAGQVDTVADVTASHTTLTMPAWDVEVTATYAQPPTYSSAVIVDWGDSEAHNVYGFADWDNVWLGNYTGYSSEGPDGIVAAWTGFYHTMGVNGSARAFTAGNEVVVTWYNTSGGAKTFSPQVSFDDPDYYSAGTAGTWYPMGEVTCPATGTATSVFTFDAATAGTYSRVHVCRVTNDAAAILCDKIELIMPVPEYLLTVASGTGSGSYTEGEVVAISADPAPSGISFAEWAGDADYLADPVAESTTVSMPDRALSVTATYASSQPSRAGDLNGDGFVGQADLDIVLGNWGQGPPSDGRADPSGDDFVGQADLDIVLSNWGQGTLH